MKVRPVDSVRTGQARLHGYSTGLGSAVRRRLPPENYVHCSVRVKRQRILTTVTCLPLPNQRHSRQNRPERAFPPTY